MGPNIRGNHHAIDVFLEGNHVKVTEDVLTRQTGAADDVEGMELDHIHMEGGEDARRFDGIGGGIAGKV